MDLFFFPSSSQAPLDQTKKLHKLFHLVVDMRLDSNIESKSRNNTYLNFIKIFNKLFKKNEHHQNAKFGSNIDGENRIILSLREK